MGARAVSRALLIGETKGGIGPVLVMSARSSAACSTRAGPHSSRRSSRGRKWARSSLALGLVGVIAGPQHGVAHVRGEAAGARGESRAD